MRFLSCVFFVFICCGRLVAQDPGWSAKSERLAAFANGPLSFASKGTVKAFMVKLDRSSTFTLSPVKENGVVVAVDAISKEGKDKEFSGRLEITNSGSFQTANKELTNVCNVGNIDPGTRLSLLNGIGPFSTAGQVEVSGNLHAVESKHSRQGEVAEDGSMVVLSETASKDGKVRLRTTTTLAPDGLPWESLTTGTIYKSLVSFRVHMKVQRVP